MRFKLWLETNETDSQFLQRTIQSDQELRNLFAHEIKNGWSQEIVNQFVAKNNSSQDDVFNDKLRIKEFIQKEPTFNYDNFSKKDWDNYFIIAMHADTYPNFQLKALSIFEKFGKSNLYKNLLIRIARNKNLVNIPMGYTLNIDNIDSEAKKFNIDWTNLKNVVFRKRRRVNSSGH